MCEGCVRVWCVCERSVCVRGVCVRVCCVQMKQYTVHIAHYVLVQQLPVVWHSAL